MHDIIIVAIVFGTVVTIVKAGLDHATRMKLIEKGMVGESGKPIDIRLSQSSDPSLKWGMVLVLVGGVLLVMELLPTVFSEEVIFGVALIAAGVAFLIHYVIADHRSKQLREHQPVL